MPERKGHFAPQNTFLDTIARRFDGTHSNFLLGSALTPGGHPIIYCSDGFCELTGFQRAQLMQKSCSCPFLYGEETRLEDREQIEIALEEQREFKGKMILYKKNKEAFHCFLDIVPIKNDKKEVVMFLISHKKIPMPERSDPLHGSLLSLETNSSVGSDNTSDSMRRENFKHLGHRRRSRAVLFTLSENLESKKKEEGCYTSFIHCLLAQRSSSPNQIKTVEKRPSRLTILHFGTGKTVWDWLVMVVTIYVIAVVPYYAALQSVQVPIGNGTDREAAHHDADAHGNTATMVFDILVEVVFIVDILLTFRTTFVDESGWVVSDAKQIAIKYFKTWFCIDFIAAIPIDTLSHIFDLGYIAQPLALLKTVRLLRLLRLYNRIDRWTQYSAVLLFILMLMFGLLAHWLACVWFIIGWSEVPTQAVTGVGWLYELSDAINMPFHSNGTGGPDINSAYITSLYFTLSSLTSVGFGNVSGNTNKEKIFSICVMIIGALMHAVVFGNVTAIIQRMYAKRSQYDIKVRDLKDFIKVHRLSKETKGQMVSHFQNTWEANGGVNAKKVLRDFPKDIQIEVAVQIYKDALSLPALQKGPKGFSRLLSLHIHRRKVAPEDYLIYSGDPLLSVIFVCKGTLEVVKNGLCIGMLSKGDLLGADVGGPRHQPLISQADVKATYPCELECISINGITDVMDVYPEYADEFVEHMRSDFSFNLWQSASNSQGLDDSHSSKASLESKTDSSKWPVLDSETSHGNENNTSFVSDDLNISPDEKKLALKYDSDEDFSNINESTSLFIPSCQQEFPSLSEKTYFDMKSNDRQKAQVSEDAESFAFPTNQKTSEKCDVVFDKGDFVTSTPSLARNNSVMENSRTPSHSSLKSDTLVQEGKSDKSNKISNFVNSFMSVFSGKSTSDSEENLRSVSCDNSMEMAARPSCFKKSFMSLQCPSPNIRPDSPGSDASSVIKRVTFCDDLSTGSTSSSRRSKRSLSIPGEDGKNILPLGFEAASRRHSDADLPPSTFSMDPKRESFPPVFVNHEVKLPDSNPANQTEGNRDDVVNLSDICGRFPANSSDYSSELSAMQSTNRPSDHILRWRSNSDTTCPKVTPPLMKGNYESPQKGNPRRRRRQRRKSNSPNSFSQIHSRRKAKFDDGDIASDSRISVDSRDELTYSGSDTQLRNDDGSLSSQLSFNELGYLSDSYFVDRLQEINSKVDGLQAEIRYLVTEVRETRARRIPIKISLSDSDLNCTNLSTNSFCRPPSPKMSRQRPSPVTRVGEPHGVNYNPKTPSSPNRVGQRPQEGKMALNNKKIFNRVSTSKGNDVSVKNANRTLPVCMVTSPAGETDDVIIDYEKKFLLETISSKRNNPQMDFCDPRSTFDPRVPSAMKETKNLPGGKKNNCIFNDTRQENQQKRHLPNPFPCNNLRHFSSSSSLGSISSFTSVHPSHPPKHSFKEEDYYTPTGTPPEDNRYNYSPTSVFIPIGNAIESPPMSDVDLEYRTSRGLSRRGSGRKGNESGYISTSPTIQLRE